MIQPQKRQKTKITHAGRTIYLNNKELLIALKESNDNKKMSDTLAKMLQKLCARYATKGNWVNYSWNEDMQAYAMFMLTRTWQSFNAEKGSNPFAFFTQCIKHSFVQYLNTEKRHRNIRDTLIVQQGLSASFGFMEDSDQHFVDDEQDYEFHKSAASQLYQYNLSAADAPIIRNEIGEFVDILDITDNLDDNNEITY